MAGCRPMRSPPLLDLQLQLIRTEFLNPDPQVGKFGGGDQVGEHLGRAGKGHFDGGGCAGKGFLWCFPDAKDPAQPLPKALQPGIILYLQLQDDLAAAEARVRSPLAPSSTTRMSTRGFPMASSSMPNAVSSSRMGSIETVILVVRVKVSGVCCAVRIS